MHKTYNFTYDKEQEGSMALFPVPTPTSTLNKTFHEEATGSRNIDNMICSKRLFENGETNDDMPEPNAKKSKATDTNIVDILTKMDQKLDVITGIQQQLKSLSNSVESNKTEIVKINQQLYKNKENVTKLDDKVASAMLNNERTDIELRKINLLFTGVNEAEGETLLMLKMEIQSIIKSITGQNIDVDTVQRLGKPTHNRARQVKVRFFALNERNSVWNNRFKTSRMQFINEDFPESTNKAAAILRKKQRELKTLGIESRLNPYNKSLKTADAVFTIDDDFVMHEAAHNLIEVDLPEQRR